MQNMKVLWLAITIEQIVKNKTYNHWLWNSLYKQDDVKYDERLSNVI